MNNNDLTTSDLWDDRWKDKKKRKVKRNNTNEILRVINETLKGCPINGRLLELGGAPGTMAHKHFMLRPDLFIDSIDFSKEGVEQTKKLYEKHGIKGEVILSDFREYSNQINEKYDFVCSYGLIEHFENYDEIIKYHLDLVKLGGVVLITVPNYSVFPVRFLLKLFSKETINSHNLKCMNEDALRNSLNRLGGKNIRTGKVGISTFPHSAIDPGVGGALYRLFCKSWNFINSFLNSYTNGYLAVKLWRKNIYVISNK